MLLTHLYARLGKIINSTVKNPRWVDADGIITEGGYLRLYLNVFSFISGWPQIVTRKISILFLPKVLALWQELLGYNGY